MRHLPCKKSDNFFDGHDRHFDDRALRHIECQNIQPFVMKEVDSTNNHTNDNKTNSKMKYLYNEAKDAWILKYGTAKFLPHHTNYILGGVWGAFKVLDGNNVIN